MQISVCVCVCVCVCARACARTCTCIPWHMYDGQRTILCISPHILPCLRKGTFVVCPCPFFIFIKKENNNTASCLHRFATLRYETCSWMWLYIRDYILKTDIASPCNCQMLVAPQTTVEQSPSPPHLFPPAIYFAGISRAWSVACGFCHSHRDFIFIPVLLYQKNKKKTAFLKSSAITNY